jgi:hypothetical protein
LFDIDGDGEDERDMVIAVVEIGLFVVVRFMRGNDGEENLEGRCSDGMIYFRCLFR